MHYILASNELIIWLQQVSPISDTGQEDIHVDMKHITGPLCFVL